MQHRLSAIPCFLRNFFDATSTHLGKAAYLAGTFAVDYSIELAQILIDVRTVMFLKVPGCMPRVQRCGRNKNYYEHSGSGSKINKKHWRLIEALFEAGLYIFSRLFIEIFVMRMDEMETKTSLLDVF